MGNKMTRSKSMSDADGMDAKQRKAKKKEKEEQEGKNGQPPPPAAENHAADLVTSCPDLGGAVPYKGKDETDLNITLYRSYGTMPDSRGDLRDSEPEIRIYRRSTTGLPPGKTMSLPRSFGRRHANSAPVNGIPRYPELRMRKSTEFNFDSPDSGRTSATGSVTSLHSSRVPITPSDFPNTMIVKKKLAQFEQAFVRSMVDKFTKLSKTLQISSLSVAVHCPRNSAVVSLFDYLDTQQVPLDLSSDLGLSREYTLTIPTAIFYGIMHVRRDKVPDEGLWLALAKDIVTCVAMESAGELARMFEYQIAVIGEEVSIRVLADHAALCVIGYMRSEHCHLDRNTMIRGAVRGVAIQGDGSSPLLSIILGSRELKWYVDEVFKKPALRKEMFLFSDDLEVDDEHPPWQFLTSDQCKPMLYGYRGLMLTWDFARGVYVLDTQDEKTFDDEMMYRYDDFARLYCPYRRLIGLNVMTDYCRQRSSGLTDMSLAQFVRNAAGPALYGKDEVQPVYRPLGAPPDSINFQKANLDNSDLSRIQLSWASLSGGSVRGCRLQGAQLEGANLTKANTSGADLSYTDLSKAKVKSDTLKDVTARHVTMSKPSGSEVESTRTMVSDRDGNVTQVDTAIESKKKEVEEDKRRAAEKRASSTGQSPEGGVILREKRGKPRSKKPKSMTKSVSDVGPRQQVNGHPEFREVPVQRKVVSTISAAPPPPAQDKGATLPRADSSRARPQSAVIEDSPGRALSAGNVTAEPPNNYLRPKTANTAYRKGVKSDAFPDGRMVKSVSHHGELPGSGRTGSLHECTAQGYYQGKRIPSFAEVEYMRKSQVFLMIKGLQIQNIESNLPLADPILVGRTHDIEEVVELASSTGRVVTLTGSWGVGKSELAVSVAKQLQPKFILPLMFNLRGCRTTDSVIRRVVRQFGLALKPNEMKLFYNWLNCREQRFLFVFDNLDLKGDDENKRVSEFIDNMMFHVRNLRVLCTSRSNFFRGQSSHESYRVGSIPQRSQELLQQLVPDLHAEGVTALAEACDHVPLLLRLLAKIFLLDDIDTGKLFEDITQSRMEDPLLPKIKENIEKLTQDESEVTQLENFAACLLKCIYSLPKQLLDFLEKLASYPSFGKPTALAAFSADEKDRDEAENALRLLVRLGLLTEIAQETHYAMQPCVHLILKTCAKDEGARMTAYQQEGVTVLKQLVEVYHSHKAIEAVREFNTAFDFIEDVMWNIIEREDAYEACQEFATLQGAIFLTEELSELTYMSLFESMEQQAEDRGDRIIQVRALCAMAYRFVENNDIKHGSGSIQKAYEIVHNQPETIGETDRALTLYCLGKLYWLDESDRNQAQNFVKKALDTYKKVHGMRHLETLYAYELYGWMLTNTENYQSARHFYNVSDFVARELLDEHPQLIAGYDSRRAIWDKLSLFARATDVAKKAAKIAEQFYGEHPITAKMQSRFCESIIKRGSLNEAIRAGVGALSTRMKLLGNHMDTAASYKEMAYLMLRSGQYDESARFSQSALDLYDKLHANERYKIEMKNLMAQARYRLQYHSSVFVQLESKDASKKDVRELLNTSVASAPPETVHTAV